MLHPQSAPLAPLGTKEAPDLTSLKEALDGYQTDVKALKDDLTQRLDAMELKAQRPRRGGGGMGEDLETRDALAAERKAVGAFVANGDETEMKGLSVSNDAAGGYLVHEQLSTSMTAKIHDQSPMRRLCRIETMGTGDSWVEPFDPSDVGAEWVGESESRTETDNASLGMLEIPLNEIYAHQTVTQRFLDDSYMDVGAWVEGKIADKFGRTEGAAAISGSGVGRPKGFLSYATSADADAARAWGTIQFKPSLGATTVTADGLRDLQWSLRAPYRQGAAWLMNSATANAIDKLKDGNGDYLWRDGMTAGAPPSLLGRPVEFDETMPDIGAGTFPIAFGDFKRAYVIIDRPGVKWLRDPYTSKPNVIIYAYRRTGGGLANSEALKLLKVAAS